MRAVLCTELNDTPVVRMVELASPPLSAGQIRIHVHAAGLNFADLLLLQGKYQEKPALPFTPGMEVSGVIAEIGAGVAGFAIGDRVLGICGLGGFAEEAVLDAGLVYHIPDTLGSDAAAGFPIVYGTAHLGLTHKAKLLPGETLLVHGAAGGVGLACVDLARALGCRVIAASASDAKLDLITRAYAPDAVVNVTGGFREAVKAITGGRGADVIYDPVGGDIFDESTRCIAFDGRLLVIGFTSGRISTVAVNIPLIKGFSVMGVRAGEYGRQFPAKGAENQDAIWALAEAGLTHPRVHAELPLRDWRAAFDLLADRAVVGKAVIRPDL